MFYNKLLYFVNTNIPIKNILKFSIQNGSNILLYRNVILKKDNEKFIKTNNYVLMADHLSINNLKKFFKKNIIINNYNVEKLNFLLNLKYFKFKFVNVNQTINELIVINNIDIDILKNIILNHIYKNILNIFNIIPFRLIIIKNNNNYFLKVFFRKNISLFYKQMVYIFFKNMIITINDINNNDNVINLLLN